MRAFVVLFSLSVSQAAHAGLRLEYQEEGEKESGSLQRIELQGDKLRFDHTMQGRPDTRTMIFDGTHVITVDNQNKTFMVIDPAMVKAQMDALKARLSPEARANLDRVTQKENPSTVTFHKGTGGGSVLGFSCANYIQMRDGTEHGTLCVASWKDGPVKKEEIAALIKLTDIVAKTYQPPGMTKSSLLFNPSDWPGFPLEFRSQDGKSGKLKSVTRGAIPESEFQPPVGYTEKPMPTFGAGHHE
jgi:hypothetical protein